MARPILTGDDLLWATRYQPGGRRALLGGDFFDAIQLDDGTVRAIVGDVCGHGPDEAALGVALRVAWRALVLADQPPDVTLPALHRVLEAERQSEEIFATVCDLELHPDRQHAEMHLAGHPSPILISGGSAFELSVEARGPLLGVFEDSKWPTNQVELGPEWTLVIFTDGIIEGRDGHSNALPPEIRMGCVLQQPAAATAPPPQPPPPPPPPPRPRAADQPPDVTSGPPPRRGGRTPERRDLRHRVRPGAHPDRQHAEIHLAGHPSPILISGGKAFELPVEARGPLLGLFEDSKWPTNQVELGAEWTLVIFTDGILEGRDGKGDRFETAGLARLALQSMEHVGNLEALADELILATEEANGEPLRDDVALLLLSTSTHWSR